MYKFFRNGCLNHILLNESIDQHLELKHYNIIKYREL